MSKTPSFIPSDWVPVPLKDLCHRRVEPFAPEGTEVRLPYLGLEHIEPQTHVLLGIGDSTEAVSLKTKFYKGDVLYGKLRPNLNKVIRAEFDGVCSTEILPIQACASEDSDYIYLALQDKRYLDYAESMTAGTQHPRVSWRDISRYQIALPKNRWEKEAIATSMGLVEHGIAATQASIAAAQKLKQALMQNLLTGKLKPDGTWRREDKFYIDPKFGRVPTRWSVKKGKNLFRIHGGTASKDSRGKPLSATCLFMKVEDFNTPANDPFIVETENAFEPPPAKPVYPCKPGWIVVAKRGAAISHNRVRMLAKEAILDPNLMAIEMLGEHSPEYFRYLLLLERLDRYSEVSSIPQLNNKDLYPRSFVMPPPDEQAEILKAIESVEAVFKSRNKKLSILRTLKAALMQNLLSGKIRIPAE